MQQPIKYPDYNEHEWLQHKWNFRSEPIPEEYRMSIFSKNVLSMQNIQLPLSDKGLCFIRVQVYTQIGEFADEEASCSNMVAMIDTGASDTFISRRLANTLGLKIKQTKAIMWGFDAAKEEEKLVDYSGAFIRFTEVNQHICLNVYIQDGMETKGRDVVLGSDFLNTVKFVRNGHEGIFELIF